MGRLSRRQFGKLAAGATAGLLLSRGSAQALPRGLAFSQFKHVVVVMFENRSFDNFFGYLYSSENPPSRGQAFAGVTGQDLSNPLPAWMSGGAVSVHPATATNTPDVDPGEEWQHVNTQLYGDIRPISNFGIDADRMSDPFNLPDPPLPNPAPMNGFVRDYISNWQAVKGANPTPSQYAQIMACYPPELLPNFSELARSFGVCDHWFCSVPSQTWTNRSFFHAAQSAGYVNNWPYVNWELENWGDTIFDRLSEAGLPWKIYIDPLELFSLTVMIHPRLWEHVGHVHFMSTFYADVANGTLPAYSFIEPRMLIRHNDAHPPSDVTPADQLVGEIYNAIRASSNPNGSNYENTLLIVTFDEHGGTFDHVVPAGGAMATPPLSGDPAGQYGFRFDRLGMRVPTVLISPYIEAGTVINTPLTHTSVIRTLCEQWGLNSLTRRDANSPDLGFVFNRSTPRDVADLPIAGDHGPRGVAPDNSDQPLTGIQQDLVGLMERYAPPAAEPIETVGEAHAYLRQSAAARGFGGRRLYLPFVARQG